MPAQKFVDKHSLKTLNMEPIGIPPNTSQQYLVNECDGVDAVGHITSSKEGEPRIHRRITINEWLTVVILCFVNLINYMDRYTIAGVLEDIQKHFNVGNDMSGLLQTAFVLSYMVFAPLFGYLGDRYSRRIIMAFGVFLWSLTTLIGSFMDDYYWFLLFRTLVGVGEASYSTIAPTIISDLFVQDMRTKMLALFYFAIPVGSGLGYIVGSETAKAVGQWQWSLRVTPILGAVAVLLIIFVLIDPKIGESEGKIHLTHTSWKNDITILCKNKSFMLSTFGFTCVAFVGGALAWWGPQFVYLGIKMQPGKENTKLEDVSYKFGLITMACGLLGVLLGSVLAQKLRRTMPRADPIICATGLLLSAPFLFCAALMAKKNELACFALIFVGQVTLNLNWSIVADILLYVVAPMRRSTAEAFQILISHALGDAGSPYIIGVISEALKKSLSASAGVGVSTLTLIAARSVPVTPEVEFHSLQYALFTTCFVEVIGGFFFLLTALYIVNDRNEAEREIEGLDNPDVPTHLYADDPLSRSEVNLTSA